MSSSSVRMTRPQLHAFLHKEVTALVGLGKDFAMRCYRFHPGYDKTPDEILSILSEIETELNAELTAYQASLCYTSADYYIELRVTLQGNDTDFLGTIDTHPCYTNE